MSSDDITPVGSSKWMWEQIRIQTEALEEIRGDIGEIKDNFSRDIGDIKTILAALPCPVHEEMRLSIDKRLTRIENWSSTLMGKVVAIIGVIVASTQAIIHLLGMRH